MRKIALLLISALLFVLYSAQEISAQVYKYVDKDGVVHFTDTPTDKKFQKESNVGWDNSVRSKAKSEAASQLLKVKSLSKKIRIPEDPIPPVRIDITPPPNTPAHLTEMRSMPGVIPPPNTPQHLIRMK